MRKSIMLTLTMLMVSALSFAEEVGTPKFWTVPAIFTPTDEVTFYYDMTDVGFKEAEELYLWCWQPTEPDHDNGAHSSDFAKLTYDGDNIYHITMVPLDYFFNRSSYSSKEELLDFMENTWGEAGYWQRIRTVDGSMETAVICPPKNNGDIQLFKDSGKEYQVYSGQAGNYTDAWTLDKPLSVLFNGDQFKIGDRTLNEVAQDANFLQFGVHSGMTGIYTNADNEEIIYDWGDANNNLDQSLDVWRPECLKKVQVKSCGNGVWKWDVITPQEYYAYNPVNTDESPNGFFLKDLGIADGSSWKVNTDFATSFVAQSIKFMIVKVNQDPNWDGGSATIELKAGTAEAYPDPTFSIFPSKVSALDIVTFTRQYNARTDGELTWTITADGKAFSGVMGGNRDKREGSANLLGELAGKTGLTKVHLTITNAKGENVIDEDIPLVTVDE